jgi:hypothetical protein
MEGLILILSGIKVKWRIFSSDTLKEPRLVQFDKVLFKWFTSVQENLWLGIWYLENLMYFYDEIKITYWCTFFESWLQTLKDQQLHLKTYGGIGIVWWSVMFDNLSGPEGARLKEFYYTTKFDIYCEIFIYVFFGKQWIQPLNGGKW